MDKTLCSVCGTLLELEHNGAKRKRLRKRKCDSCRNQVKKTQKREDPVVHLRAKFFDSMRKKKIALPEALTAKEQFDAIYKRCDGRSVLSGESNYLLLTIVSRKQIPEEPNDLFLVTIGEAKRIAFQSDVVRLETFRETMQLQGLF